MSIVTLWVASADTQSERRFDKALSLETLKTKLEPITGIPAAAQSLELYQGPTHFSSGYWVGVEYDEPLGKNDGSIDGERYFSCLNKHGAFVRPNRVILGDFDDDIDWDNLDEM
ncbi:hypothetical protein H4R33_003804 [Dimargaris cristalligena]|nr:hypothetical protein H4R33_003804 [Dimargaris cristalligena]